MRSNDYLWNICLEIYQRMYAEADPPLNFNAALSCGLTAKPDWFMNYYLPMERQVEIVEEVMKKYHCSRYEKRAINHEIWLGGSPNGYKKEKV